MIYLPLRERRNFYGADAAAVEGATGAAEGEAAVDSNNEIAFLRKYYPDPHQNARIQPIA